MRMRDFWDLLSALIGLIASWMVPLLWFVAIKIFVTIAGALFGWIIGWFIGSTVLGILAQLGITGFSMWQIGAFLGFVGSFFGSTLNFNDFRSFKFFSR